MSSICDDLRAAILQAAMQGKLTKQLSEDGDAQELLAHRYDDCNKKHKPTAISDEEIPFSIPVTWQWVRIGDFFDTITGGTPSKTHSEYYGGNYAFFKPSDLDAGKYITSASEFLTEAGRSASRQLPANTILVCCIGSIGKAAIMGTEGTTNQQINAILPNNYVNVNYLYYAIKSPVFFEKIWSLASSTTISIANKSKMDSIIIPLPPLAEQKRIAEKVDELMSRITDLEKSADALASLKKSFPDDIKASLLQAAMQGKLTEQLPEDGTAEELLEQIKAEKEKLIAEGKIKKQKTLTPIADDEIPFEIPNNWKWVRLRNLCIKDISRGKSPEYSKRETGFFAFAQKCNSKYEGIRLDLSKSVAETFVAKRNDADFVKSGDIVINSTGTGTLGRVGYIKEIEPNRFIADSHVTTVRVSNRAEVEYLCYWLKANEDYFIEHSEGSTNQKELKPATIMDFLVPVPPIAEQVRIVKKLNELLPIASQIKGLL